MPNEDVESLTNAVSAAVLSVPLPFVGVDGTSACDNVYNADGTPAGCSLKKGVEYHYKREFPILPIYPTVSVSQWTDTSSRLPFVPPLSGRPRARRYRHSTR